MPTYEYQCQSCNSKFEFEQSIKAEPFELCTACKSFSLKRLISGGTAFSLKGDGWYKDGYSSKKDK